MGEWIGVDLDGTLARYDKNFKPLEVGEPIQPMVDLVKQWRREGLDVRIFTARAATTPITSVNIQGQIAHARKYGETMTEAEAVKRIETWNLMRPQIIQAVEQWCLKHLGEVLPITCEKDFMCKEIWDDRAVRVVFNEGRRCCE